MKRRIVSVVGGIALGLAMRVSLAAAQSATPVLDCRVDPAVELLSVLALLGDPSHPPELDFPYAREVRVHFGAYVDHPAVRRAAAIVRAGYDDFGAQLGSRLGPPPALAERRPLRPVGDGPSAVQADSLRGLVAQARDFAQRSDFATFFDAHAALYRSLCDRVLADSSLRSVAARTSTFFGVRAGGYQIVLMPLVPRLGVSPPGVQAAPEVTLTAYLGPAGASGDEPRFRTGWAIERLVLHEFTHQYVNAPVYLAYPALRRSSALLAPVRGRVWRADRVATWPGVVTETVVRAAVAVMRGDAAGDTAERAELREHRAFGFTLVDSIAATLRGARAARTRRGTPWWPAAMQDVVATFDRIAASPHAREIADPPFAAGMTQALVAAAPDSLAFIVPSTTRDAALGDSLRAHVARMRDRYARRGIILTDREALARDLRGWTLWAIGTLDENAWLAAHREALPMRVDSTRVVADAEYRGQGLVFVGAFPSPVDPRRPLLVTIGQRLDELARGWWIVGSDYAVMDGTRALTRGTYVVDGTQRRFVPNVVSDTAPAR